MLYDIRMRNMVLQMRPGGGKQKGDAFERKCAKRFTQWWFANGEGLFKRVPKSGGWDKALTPGDIFAVRLYNNQEVIDETFPFSIECKKQERWTLEQLLTSTKPPLLEWHAQAVNDCKATNKTPLVVFAKNRTAPLVAVDTNYKLSLSFISVLIRTRETRVIIKSGGVTLWVTTLDAFLNVLQKEHVIND